MPDNHVTIPPMKRFRCPNGIALWHGGRANRDTRVIYKEIFEQRCYEKHGIRVNDGDVIFDVGSHIGMFTLSLMERFRNLQLYCFEPAPETLACLTRNLHESPRRANHRLVVFNTAVGAKDGESSIAYYPAVPGISTLYPADKRREFETIFRGLRFTDLWIVDPKLALILLPIYRWRRFALKGLLRRIFSTAVTFPCTVRRLSNIVRAVNVQQIDFLKIDVEGAEMDVLAGIDEAHWPAIKQISMEVDPMNKPHLCALCERLRTLGFANISIEGMLDRGNPLDERGPCTLYAVRSAMRRPAPA